MGPQRRLGPRSTVEPQELFCCLLRADRTKARGPRAENLLMSDSTSSALRRQITRQTVKKEIDEEKGGEWNGAQGRDHPICR